MLGTTGYAAPEQLASARDVDGRADVYAMGCVMYQMLTGAPPSEVYRLERDDPSLAALPWQIVGVVLRATRYRPENRFSSAAEMPQGVLDVATSFGSKGPLRQMDSDVPFDDPVATWRAEK